MKTNLFSWLIATATAFGSASVHAHHIWLEQPSAGGSAQLYFGEFGGNLREASPGLLDKFVKPSAHKLGKAEPVPLTLSKGAQSYALSARARAGESLIAEEANYPISERKQGEQTVRSLYHPAARLVTDWSEQAARLKLDLVPTGRSGKEGRELRATYNGQPLPKAKVVVVTAAGWSQEHRTADDGTLRVQLPWRGSYVLELSHNDAGGGEREGQRYDRASYVTSLTVVQAKGLPQLPAAPPAPPNKMN
jgi:uncharacterized GH25 family protein